MALRGQRQATTAQRGAAQRSKQTVRANLLKVLLPPTASRGLMPALPSPPVGNGCPDPAAHSLALQRCCRASPAAHSTSCLNFEWRCCERSAAQSLTIAARARFVRTAQSTQRADAAHAQCCAWALSWWHLCARAGVTSVRGFALRARVRHLGRNRNRAAACQLPSLTLPDFHLAEVSPTLRSRCAI